MRALPVLALVLFTLTGCDKLKGKTTGTVASGATASVAPDSMKVDKVDDEGGPIKPDGTKDGAINFVVEGPIAGVILLTTDKDGKPEGGQQWDTYNAGQKIPASIGAPFDDGEPTWQLGVWEGGKMKNAADGSLTPLPAGPHQLVLYAADSGHFAKGEHFIVFAERPDHSVVKSNVFSF